MSFQKHLSQEFIIQAAADLAEEIGLEHLTLKQLAEKLNIQTPSLYNHIAGLPGLYEGLAAFGLTRLGTVIGKAAIGKSQSTAIKSIASEYRKFAKSNQELYKAILQCPGQNSKDIKEAKNIVFQILHRVLYPYGFSAEDSLHSIRAFRSAMHGFISLESAGFFKAPCDPEVSYDKMISALIAGLLPSG